MKNNDVEYRSASSLQPDGEKAIVRGRAIIFGKETLLGKDRFGTEYWEVVEPSALDGVDISSTPLKYNHSTDKAAILARQQDKSLLLEKRADGVYFSAELRSNLGQDVYSAVVAGDISGCSFGFLCEKDHYEQRHNCIVRHIDKISKLTDISIVDNPAYNQTSVEARNDGKAAWVAEKEASEIERKRLVLLTYC